MDSFLKIFLKKIADRLSQHIKKINFLEVKPNTITTLGIIFNAFGLLNLLYGKFIIFIVLFISAYFCDILDGVYAKKYNLETKTGKVYDRTADWIKLLTLYSFFTTIYENKIGNVEIVLAITILIMCNIHFTVKEKININLNKGNDEKTYVKHWTKLIKFINHSNLIDIIKFSKFFDEPMTVFYLIILMCYIHYK